MNARRRGVRMMRAALMLSCLTGGVGFAQNAPGGVSVTGYTGATAMVQDPPGTAWQSVPTANLPAPAPVSQMKQDQWVEIMEQGRPVRISIMNVTLAGVQVPGVVTCPEGKTPTTDAGSAGLGGC